MTRRRTHKISRPRLEHPPRKKHSAALARPRIGNAHFTVDTTGKRIQIGGNYYGKVYLGRVRFQGGKPIRVAIKVFTRELGKEHFENFPKEYNQTISILRNAGVRLPKMGMIAMKLPHEDQPRNVLVSQLFGSTAKGSKLESPTHMRIFSKKAAEEAIGELTKIVNAGFKVGTDIVEPLRNKQGSIPIDIDLLVSQHISKTKHGPLSSKERVGTLMDCIDYVALDRKQALQLFQTALEHANPETKKELQLAESHFRRLHP